ncbi:MAG TPA: alpha/beta hydrolase [Candidatus Elarobacter sp.]|nr:alpha/beta hydrolase [Candidatus Elarobacter sp.]
MVIELRSMRFCMVRFGMRHDAGIGGGASVFEEHFGDVGGYWVKTDGFIETTGRLVGISAVHGRWRYRLLDIQFPDSLPAAAFAPIPRNDAFDPGPYLRAQRLVDIGGRRLNLYCTGQGSPAVVLEAGGGDDMLDWRFVQPEIAKRTRVCSYDRAGAGFSDPGPPPRDASAVATDLHALLARAGITGPFVLVGYSDGAQYSRLYADRYANDLAGLVLVEPGYESDEEERQLQAAAPEVARDAQSRMALARRCAAASQNGQLKPGNPMFDACAPAPDPDLPDTLNALRVRETRRPGWWANSVSENEAALLSATRAQIHAEQRSYGSLPLVVLTARDVFPDGYLAPAEQRAVREIVQRGRAGLTSYSSRSSQTTVDKCSHGDILTHCTAEVVSAILKAIEQK